MSRGRQKFFRLLKALPDAAIIAFQREISKQAHLLAARMKAEVPKDTGALAESIRVETSPLRARIRAGGKATQYTLPDGAVVDYALTVEFGRAPFTAGGKFAGAEVPATAGRPFFYTEYRVARRQMRSEIKKAGKKAIQNAVRKTK